MFKSGPVTQRVTASREKRRSQEKTTRCWDGLANSSLTKSRTLPDSSFGLVSILMLNKTKNKNNISSKKNSTMVLIVT